MPPRLVVEPDVRAWLRTLDVDRAVRYTYLSVVRRLMRLAKDQALSNVDSELVIRWIRTEASGRPFERVCNRVNIVSRFLAWRAQLGLGLDVVAQLRAEHSATNAQLVHALLEPDFRAALARRAELKPWGSHLGLLLKARIDRMRMLGFRYQTMEVRLKCFDRFLQKHPDLSGKPLAKLIEAWSQSLTSERSRLDAQYCARAISKELSRETGAVALPEVDRALSRKVLSSERRPHTFSHEEVMRLLGKAAEATSVRNPHWGVMVSTMMTILCCTGLRIGELHRLTLADIDLDEHILVIRHTKFHKSRSVPFAASVGKVLQEYLIARAAVGGSQSNSAPVWWSAHRRRGLGYHSVRRVIGAVIRKAGFKITPGRKGPRIHDLRHTFISLRITEWYREGRDVQNLLPFLATYVGHVEISSTLPYLNHSAEVLQLASRRFGDGLADRVLHT